MKSQLSKNGTACGAAGTAVWNAAGAAVCGPNIDTMPYVNWTETMVQFGAQSGVWPFVESGNLPETKVLVHVLRITSTGTLLLISVPRGYLFWPCIDHYRI